MRIALVSVGTVLVLMPILFAGCGNADGDTQDSITSSHFEGGEKSIEDFGAEAEGEDRAAILSAEHGYLIGLAKADLRMACSHLAAEVRSSLEQLIPRRVAAKGCVAGLPRLLSSSAPEIARQQADAAITKVRFQGGRAFVIFRAPGAKLYQFTMAREGIGWKVTTVAPSVLVPELPN